MMAGGRSPTESNLHFMSVIKRAALFPLKVLTRFLWRLEPWVRNLGANSGFWAVVYYAVFKREFAREQRSFLAGRREYDKSLMGPRGSIAVLRRNVHRLEKGLLMRPRRIPFGRDYIAETVKAYLAASQNGVDTTELSWACDVLREYFAVHSELEELKKLGASIADKGLNGNPGAPRFIPYQRDLSSVPPVDYAALYSLARRRRSVRWFEQRPVPREMVDRAIEVAVQAPSACNRQPFEFRIFDERELVQKVVSIPFGLAGYEHNVPCIAVIVGQHRNYFDERDRHLIYIDASLAVMGFLLALEAQGLSACCVNWPDIEEREKRMAHLLKLAPDERPVMLVAFGYPDPAGMVAYSAKKSLDTIRHYNFE